MKKRILLAVVAAGLTVTAGAVVLPADAASPSVVISTVYYDQPGNDLPATTTKLNREWVELRNVSRQDRAISGFTLVDEKNHRYVFAKKTVIKAGDWMRIHTGPGRNTPHHKYYGNTGQYIWNNDGDTAYLKNKAGTNVDTCSWNEKRGRSQVTC